MLLMTEAKGRPTKLSAGFLGLFLFLVGVSLCSGIILWFGIRATAQTLEPKWWMHPARVVHGVVTPFLCACFGYLCYLHIPRGWQMKLNRPSGVMLTVLFAFLILSGTA